MSLLAFHPALRTNTSPYSPNTGVIRTVNLALDDPDNFGLFTHLSHVDVRHSKIVDQQLMEVVGRYATRERRWRGLGTRMQWAIAGTVFMGTPGDLSTGEFPLQQLLDDLGVGMTGQQDGTSTYLWFSPNYRWNEPEEQWILVVPKQAPVLDETDGKGWGLKFGFVLETVKNYRAITWVELRRGFTSVGPSNLTLSFGSPLVVGTPGFGGTRFKRDFIYGDDLLNSSGALLGTVLSVQADDAMTLQANAAANYGPSSYQYRQRSAPSFLVPVYTLTEFEQSRGWGRTPWGQDWGSPSP